jgi:hypothetical protein
MTEELGYGYTANRIPSNWIPLQGMQGGVYNTIKMQKL